MTELLEKKKFMRKRKAAEHEAETLRISKQVAKAKLFYLRHPAPQKS